MILEKSTVAESLTGGVERSTTVILVDGKRRLMARAVDSPNAPAPTTITELGKESAILSSLFECLDIHIYAWCER